MKSNYAKFLQYLSLLSLLFVVSCGGGGGSSGGSLGIAPVLALFAGNLGGPGNIDNSTGSVARFYGPSSAVTDSAGNIYVTDAQNHTIRKITPAGVVTTLVGAPGVNGSTDSPPRFFNPQGITSDGTSLYVADTGNNTIRKITPLSGGLSAMTSANAVVTTIAGTAGTGTAAGINDNLTGTLATFDNPNGIATDGTNIFVADTNNHAIRQIALVSPYAVSTLAGTGFIGSSNSPTGTLATFNYPQGVATDGTNIYVADTNNYTIRQVALTGSNAVTLLVGTTGSPGFSNASGSESFDGPTGIAIDNTHTYLYVADFNNSVIRKIVIGSATVSNLAGTALTTGSADGTSGVALFSTPHGVAFDAHSGNLYVADTGNNIIRMVTLAGVATTTAGTAGVTGSGNGAGSTATFNTPKKITTDSAGNVYVADSGNGSIRKISSGGVVSDLVPSSTFTAPIGVATYGAYVYVADSTTGIISKVDSIGTVSTLVPGGTFTTPSGIATDGTYVYVADTTTGTISKITLGGSVSTLAPGFITPSGIATDGTYVYVSDSDSGTISKISSAGTVSGLASGLSSPQGIAVDSSGNVYVADTGSHTIRKITSTGTVSTIAGVVGQAGFIPGALPGVLTSPIGVAIHGTTLYITTNNGVAVITNVP